jgi:hypothetical protein
MRVVTNTLWLPKKGNTNEEYEDAAFPMESVEVETDSFRCAVADGATETSFSALWAKLLVEGFVNQTPRNESKQKWAEGIATKELPWYAEQKAESGAYAALLGLVLKGGTDGGGTWEAEALGDCCMMLVRLPKNFRLRNPSSSIPALSSFRPTWMKPPRSRRKKNWSAKAEPGKRAMLYI